MSYTPLPIETVALSKLDLDLENYRIPVKQVDENAALNYLYAEEEVFETAKLILRDGYFDNEVPIVIASDSRYIVLEGNRRVGALKVLHDPTLIPDHEHAIRALLRRYETEAEELPDRIRVLVSPSRNAASRHIARLHTTQSKRGWTLDQQATYYFSLLSSATNVDDIRHAYPGINITRFMRMAVMRRMLSGVRFKDRSLRDYVRTTDLKMSAFEYAYKNPDIATAIGVTFSSDGLLLPARSKPETVGESLKGQRLKAIEYLMSQFRRGNLNTRSDEFRKGTREQEALVALLSGSPTPASDMPEPEPPTPGGADGEGSDTPLDSVTQSTGSNGPGAGEIRAGSGSAEGGSKAVPGSRGPNHPDTKDHLVLTGLGYDAHVSANLQKRYHELRKLSLSQTPVAAAMLLRAVLESTIKLHFEGSATPAIGELKQCMQVVKAKYGSNKSIQAAILKIDSGGIQMPGSVKWFNNVTHSADAVVTPDTVRQALELLNPVLRHLLRPEPAVSP